MCNSVYEHKFQGSGTVSKLVAVTKKEKSEANRRRKQSMMEEEEDEENRDWWTKYFSSLEAVAAVSQHLTVDSLYCAGILGTDIPQEQG